MYREFIQLGADGLWLSFDDKGPGEEPEKLVFEALELGVNTASPARAS
jgi:hypothetical protein